MINRLICLLLGHSWSFWALVNNGEFCQYLKCSRCGKYKDNSKSVLDKYLQED